MTEEKKVALSENEEVSAVEQYFKNRAKKRKKTIISIIAVALAAIVAVSVLWFYTYTTDNFEIDSIKWDVSQKFHRIICRAEYIGCSDDGSTLFYKYQTVQDGLVNDALVHYRFEDDKLNEVSVIINSGMKAEFNSKIAEYFKMKNVSYTGTTFYAEYEGYHVYYEILGVLEQLEIKREITHDASVEYPDAKDVMLDSETRKLVSDASSFMILECNTYLSGLGINSSYRDIFGKYVDYTVKLCKALEKYPKNVLVMDALLDLMQKREEFSKKGMETAESLQGAEQREFAGWMIEQLKRISEAYELIPYNE